MPEGLRIYFEADHPEPFSAYVFSRDLQLSPTRRYKWNYISIISIPASAVKDVPKNGEKKNTSLQLPSRARSQLFPLLWSGGKEVVNNPGLQADLIRSFGCRGPLSGCL